MFQEAELKRLRAQKELLVLQSSAHRLLLAAECQQLRSPDAWRAEATRWLQQHPLLATALAAAGGAAVVRAVRKPSTITDAPGKLSRLISLALMTWRLVRREKSGAGHTAENSDAAG